MRQVLVFFISFLFLEMRDVEAFSFAECIQGLRALTAPFASWRRDRTGVGIPRSELTSVAYDLEEHHRKKIETALVGSFYEKGPFALQGLASNDAIYKGMVVKESELADIQTDGLKGKSEIWFSSSPTEALGYTFHRAEGAALELGPRNEKYVMIVLRVDKTRLPTNTKFDSHIRPTENPYATYTTGDIPGSAITHIFMINPGGNRKNNWILPFQGR